MRTIIVCLLALFVAFQALAQTAPVTYGYRYATFDTVANAWRADSVLYKSTSGQPDLAEIGCRIAYSSGDTISKWYHRTDASARDTFHISYQKIRSAWFITGEEHTRYTSSGTMAYQHRINISRDSTGNVTNKMRSCQTYDSNGIILSDVADRWTGTDWYTFSKARYARPSSATVPDTLLVWYSYSANDSLKPVSLTLGYGVGPTLDQDTLIQIFVYSNGQLVPSRRQYSKSTSTLFRTYSEAYNTSTQQFDYTSGSDTYYIDTLQTRYSFTYNRARNRIDTVNFMKTYWDTRSNDYHFRFFYRKDTASRSWQISSVRRCERTYRQGALVRSLTFIDRRLGTKPSDRIDFLFDPQVVNVRARHLLPSLLAYPNPATDQVRILLPPELYGSIGTLTDAAGRACAQTHTLNAEAVFDLKDLPPGLYEARFAGADGVDRVPIIKQ